jgi:CheY-like chemotaxis protein
MHSIAIGPLEANQISILTQAAERAGSTLEVHASLKQAAKELERGSLVGCILVAPNASTAKVAQWVRTREGWFNLPVVKLIAHPTDNDFQQAYVDGADDAVPVLDVAGLQRRFANLVAHNPAARPPANQGLALIASGDIAERRNLGRVLRQAGFDVAFAAEARELMALSSSPRRPTLVVATPSFPPLGGEAAVRTVRTATRNPDLPAIVLKHDEGQPAGQLSVHGNSDVRGELLFFAEEALRAGPAKDLRRSPRLHFATLCAFRQAGMMEPTYGLTHNVSQAGLFVRTLDPPPAGSELWLELRTFEGQAVHLRGTVAWRRAASDLAGTAPPGFGVKLEAEQCPALDLGKYESAYLALSRHQSSEIN